jgi:hypothetical protein
MSILKIKLPVFSGRPDPEITFTGARARDLLNKLKKFDPAALAQPADWGGLLGYDGFIATPQVDGLPKRIRIHSSLLGAGSHELEEQLLQSIGPKIERTLGIKVRRAVDTHVLDQIPVGVSKANVVLLRKPAAEAGFNPDRPVFQPEYWNDPDHIYRNNCYAAGTNNRTDTFPQPGLGSGKMYEAITPDEVLQAALRDGLKLLGDGKTFNPVAPQGWTVVLVIWPDTDYHWYRVDFDSPADKLCSHKPGGTPDRNTDNSGNPIPDPYKADRGGYTIVVATLYVPGRKFIKIA